MRQTRPDQTRPISLTTASLLPPPVIDSPSVTERARESDAYTVVILSEPPAPPYVVPHEAVERLREAVAVSGPHTFAGELYPAARALLDAAEEQA